MNNDSQKKLEQRCHALFGEVIQPVLDVLGSPKLTPEQKVDALSKIGINEKKFGLTKGEFTSMIAVESTNPDSMQALVSTLESSKQTECRRLAQEYSNKTEVKPTEPKLPM